MSARCALIAHRTQMFRLIEWDRRKRGRGIGVVRRVGGGADGEAVIDSDPHRAPVDEGLGGLVGRPYLKLQVSRHRRAAPTEATATASRRADRRASCVLLQS